MRTYTQTAFGRFARTFNLAAAGGVGAAPATAHLRRVGPGPRRIADYRAGFAAWVPHCVAVVFALDAAAPGYPSRRMLQEAVARDAPPRVVGGPGRSGRGTGVGRVPRPGNGDVVEADLAMSSMARRAVMIARDDGTPGIDIGRTRLTSHPPPELLPHAYSPSITFSLLSKTLGHGYPVVTEAVFLFFIELIKTHVESELASASPVRKSLQP